LRECNPYKAAASNTTLVKGDRVLFVLIAIRRCRDGRFGGITAAAHAKSATAFATLERDLLRHVTAAIFEPDGSSGGRDWGCGYGVCLRSRVTARGCRRRSLAVAALAGLGFALYLHTSRATCWRRGAFCFEFMALIATITRWRGGEGAHRQKRLNLF